MPFFGSPEDLASYFATLGLSYPEGSGTITLQKCWLCTNDIDEQEVYLVTTHPKNNGPERLYHKDCIIKFVNEHEDVAMLNEVLPPISAVKYEPDPQI